MFFCRSPLPHYSTKTVVGKAFVLAAFAMSAGCAVINIESADGVVRTERHFGIVGIDLGSQNAIQIAEARGFAIFRTSRDVTMGYQSSQTVVLGRQCSSAMIVNDSGKLNKNRRLAEKTQAVCSVQ